MKILICDDHQIVRQGIRMILEQEREVEHIEEARDGTEVISLLNKIIFDIIILDISLPGRSGLEILQSVKLKWPQVNVLMLSMHPEEKYAVRALKYGASGYLSKDSAAQELMLAIMKIANGGKYVSQSLGENLVSKFNPDNLKLVHETLSGREFEIMIQLANGKSIDEIANELFISRKTVTTYRSRLMLKMGFTKNTQLTKYCIENELI
jgi:two-component system, NarL family, invasion response regulator UvrY